MITAYSFQVRYDARPWTRTDSVRSVQSDKREQDRKTAVHALIEQAKATPVRCSVRYRKH